MDGMSIAHMRSAATHSDPSSALSKLVVLFALSWPLPLAAQTPSAEAPAPQAGAPAPAPAVRGPTAAPEGARVYIIAPANGAHIKSPFLVQFGLANMGVTQSGNVASNAGHHHLLVDVKEPVSATETIPSDKSHLHFGGGQTETRLDLPPGRHTLQLVLGDAKHMPFVPMLASQKIEVLVVSPHPRKRHHRRVPRFYY